MIGTTLDKYEVLQKVGEGGMATVYRGRHATLNRDVAIKVLHPHLSSSLRNRKRFAVEARAIAHLHHENILEIFDYSGIEAGDCYIVTEFVEGETLTALLQRRGRLPSEVVAAIGAATCRALAYAHAQGVLHRDIKTDNLMLRYDGTLKLMDFGIARFLDESRVTMTGALVGSPAFMSPEQAREAPLDLRSDLFAVGTVLFYLVTGHLPFSGSNPSLILKNVIEGNRPHVAELTPAMSASLADVIERLMATDPEDRFNSATEVERALRAVLEESGLDPADPSWSLAAWMEEPDAWDARLDAHLKTELVAQGRRLLQGGDHLAALRLFNRLLSMDEDNAEVLALVQSLHGEPQPVAARRSRWLAAVALVVLFVGFGVLYAASARRPPPAVLAEVAPPRLEAPRVVPSPVPEPAPAVPTAAMVVDEPKPEPQAPAPERPGSRAVRPKPPPEPVPTPVTEIPPEPLYGLVQVNTGEHVAEVYLPDGRSLGDTRSELVLPVGRHELSIRSPLLLEQKVWVEVAPGERVQKELTLRPRPSTVVFAPDVPGECAVTANGRAQGTVAGLERTLLVARPDEPLRLELDCGPGHRIERSWSTVPVPQALVEDR